MGQEVITYSEVLTHPVIVEFTCEHCGENNRYMVEIAGAGKKSKYRGDLDPKGTSLLSAKDRSKMSTKAQKQLDQGINNAKRRLEKNNFSWISAQKCVKCKRHQSWQTGQIWKSFLKNFLGVPFLLLLVVMIPLQVIFGKDTNEYPDWVMVTILGLVLVIMLGAIVQLISSLIRRDRKHHNLPTVTI